MHEISRINYYLENGYLFFRVHYKYLPMELFQYERKNGIWEPILSNYILEKKKSEYEDWSLMFDLLGKFYETEGVFIKKWSVFYEKEATRLIKKYRTKLFFENLTDKQKTLYEEKK